MVKLHPCSRFTLATTNCGKASRRNPVRRSVNPHTEHTVLDSGVVYLLLFSDAFPLTIDAIKPDMIDIGHPVVMNVKFADFWGHSKRWGYDVVRRRGGIPGSKTRGAGAKLSLLFEWG